MNYVAKSLKTVAAVGLAISCYAGSALASGTSISEELASQVGQATWGYAGTSNAEAGVIVASLEPESQHAIDWLTQQLTVAAASTYAPDAELPINSWDKVQSDVVVEMNGLQFVTLEAESSQAFDQMKRLLQQGQLPSYTPNAEAFGNFYGFEMLNDF